jgi:TrmH family RNA methyltransferase
MIINVTSKTNKVYKHIKALNSKNYREKHQEFIIEGLRLVKDAVESSIPIHLIVVSESFACFEEGQQYLQKLQRLNIQIYQFHDKLFNEIAQTQTPQGILGIVPIKDFSLEAVTKYKEMPLYIYCDGIQDPGNMGTIVRTADAFHADAVILSKGCVDIYNPKCVRSTMGSLFHLPIIKVEDTREILQYLKEKGLTIIGGHLEATDYCYQFDMKQGMVIVVGNEANGISQEALEIIDQLIKIPMPGNAESLNAAIAAGILMYEVIRQRA